LLSPYDVVPDDEGAVYRFETSNAITYLCLFVDVTEAFGTLECRIMSFNLEVLGDSHTPPPFDPRVGMTVVQLLAGFFQKYDDVIIYVADCSDGRQLKRQLRFNRWLAEYPVTGVTMDEYAYKDVVAGIIRKNTSLHERISYAIRDGLNATKPQRA
jgi:hypothetical protein